MQSNEKMTTTKDKDNESVVLQNLCDNAEEQQVGTQNKTQQRDVSPTELPSFPTKKQ